jgi:hypothetical protein
VDTIEISGVLAVPLIVGLVQVAKGAGLSARWGAPLALVLGVGISVGTLSPEGLMAEAVIRGLALGLSACGLYSAVATQLAAALPRSAAVGAHRTVASERGSK